jgi:hypothetical protein
MFSFTRPKLRQKKCVAKKFERRKFVLEFLGYSELFAI